MLHSVHLAPGVAHASNAEARVADSRADVTPDTTGNRHETDALTLSIE